jgi:hypothetical protein
MKEVEPQKGLSDAAEATDASALSDEDAKQINAITLMRIYDVLLAILTVDDPDMAEALMEKHANGELHGPMPYLNI